MFTTLIASDSKSKRKTMTPGTMVLSIVFHGLLLVGAVYASVKPPEEEAKVEEEVTFMEVEEEPPPPEQEVAPEPPPVGFQELVPPLEPPPFIPVADMSAPAINVADFSGIGTVGGTAQVVEEAAPEPVRDETFAYEVAVLDAPPALQNVAAVQAAMQRAYPRILLDAGISGRVVAQFVVQPDGSVDMSSLKIIESSNERFDAASSEVIQRFRFTPGKFKGEPVRVLIQMPIAWQAETM